MKKSDSTSLNTETKEEAPIHKIRFKKEPIWLKCNFVGKYNGIKFRFSYHEYTHDDAEEVIRKFNFTWPGRIPDNKEFAEKGIQSLFIKLRDDEQSTIDMRVIKDDITMEDEVVETTETVDDYVAEQLADEDMEKQVTEEINETIQEGQ